MLFSVIYTVDCRREADLREFTPPQVRKLWVMTEGDNQYDGHWKQGKHRKWCAELTQAQFDKFVDALCLRAEDVETGGSLGAPGYGWGWSPAISFRVEDPDADLSAYVTPIPKRRKTELTERDWQRVRKAVIQHYR